MAEPHEILDFWFGPPGPEHGLDRKIWFEKDDEFDAVIRRRFLADHEAAAAGRLDGWREEPESCLALIILLDQFSRNLFRGSPRAYACDAEALATARYALEQGYDRKLPVFARKFLYMPYMHSERIEDQRRSLHLFETLGEEEPLRAARQHLAIIERFGRFPHRNAVLGRTSIPAEAMFLQEPGSSF